VEICTVLIILLNKKGKKMKTELVSEYELRKHHFVQFLVLSIFGILLSINLCSCKDSSNNNNDDDSSYYSDDNDVPPGCENDIVPELKGIKLFVNGLETQMPAPVHLADNLSIAMEYVDENCNLEG